jgi:predicted PurR-regulated permease PerM
LDAGAALLAIDERRGAGFWRIEKDAGGAGHEPEWPWRSGRVQSKVQGTSIAVFPRGIPICMTSLHPPFSAERAEPRRGVDEPGANQSVELREETPEPALQQLDARTLSLFVIAFGVVVFLLQYMQVLFAPLAFGLLLFYVLDPFVDAMERIRIPRWLGAAVTILLTFGTIGTGAYMLQDEAMTVINQLPTAARRVTAMIDRDSRSKPGPLDKVEQAAAELQKSDASKPAPGVMRVQVEEPRVTAANLLWSGSLGAISALNQLIMIMFLTYFILLSDKMLRRKFVELAGPRLWKKKLTVEIMDSIASQIGRFLIVQVVTSVFVGIATWAALRYMGLEQAALWGLLAGVFNSIPYYGPLIVSSGLSMVAFLQFGTIGRVLAVAAISLAITSVEGWLIYPLLMGKVASMNRVAVFVGLLFWSWAWGVWGMLLAVPMMMAIKVICDNVEELKPIGRFLGE